MLVPDLLWFGTSLSAPRSLLRWRSAAAAPTPRAGIKGGVPAARPPPAGPTAAVPTTPPPTPLPTSASWGWVRGVGWWVRAAASVVPQVLAVVRPASIYHLYMYVKLCSNPAVVLAFKERCPHSMVAVEQYVVAWPWTTPPSQGNNGL